MTYISGIGAKGSLLKSEERPQNKSRQLRGLWANEMNQRERRESVCGKSGSHSPPEYFVDWMSESQFYSIV